MKRITLPFVLFWLSVFSFSAIAQNNLYIELKNPGIAPPDVDYYILDILDNRDVQSLIGMSKSDDGGEIAMIKLNSDFHSELMDFMTTAFPEGGGKSPVIISFKKMWISEFEKGGEIYSHCDLTMMFLTPKMQQFYETTFSNDRKLENGIETHRVNLIRSLFEGVGLLSGPDIQYQYFSALNSKETTTETEDTIVATDNTLASARKYEPHNTSLAFRGGYTYRFAEIPDDLTADYEDHLKRLKNGYNLGADIHIFSSEKNGFGISGSMNRAKSTLPKVALTDDLGNILAIGDVEEDISMYYVGPSYMSRLVNSMGNVHFLYTLTAGYYAYQEEMSFLGESIDIKGGSIGFGMSAGIDFLASENFALEAQVSVLMGWLNKFKIDGQSVDLEESENLSRIDLTLGIRLFP
ncbi:MAG: autotransporter outer membrane beta-barrel domain-containing protein [Bacteroidetes bacterium]|nr:autotransporter outer membrane beta-barrel domain-containing protein [Bacteroidota bacterium]